jgi:hypothetical protein
MSRKWIGAAVAALAVGGAAVATATDGGGSGVRPNYASVTIDLGDQRANVNARGGGVGAGRKAKKPRLVYLQSSAPQTINPADPAAGGVGPFIDVELTGCAKVVDGGVIPSRFDVYAQGTYVESPSSYHALIAIDEESLGDRTPFTVQSNLTCLKGVK